MTSNINNISTLAWTSTNANNSITSALSFGFGFFFVFLFLCVCSLVVFVLFLFFGCSFFLGGVLFCVLLCSLFVSLSLLFVKVMIWAESLGSSVRNYFILIFAMFVFFHFVMISINGIDDGVHVWTFALSYWYFPIIYSLIWLKYYHITKLQIDWEKTILMTWQRQTMNKSKRGDFGKHKIAKILKKNGIFASCENNIWLSRKQTL